MATILPFRQQFAQSPPNAPAPVRGSTRGEVVLFPGVRYERQAEQLPSDMPQEPKRSKKKRAGSSVAEPKVASRGPRHARLTVVADTAE